MSFEDGIGRKERRRADSCHHLAQPWNNIEQGTLTKMYTTQPEAFDKVYKRERL